MEKKVLTLNVTRAEQSSCLEPKQTPAKTKHSWCDHVGSTEQTYDLGSKIFFKKKEATLQNDFVITFRILGKW